MIIAYLISKSAVQYTKHFIYHFRSINRKEKKLTISCNETKILTVNRKRHYPIETLSVKKQNHDFQVCIVDRARHRKKLVKTRTQKNKNVDEDAKRAIS